MKQCSSLIKEIHRAKECGSFLQAAEFCPKQLRWRAKSSLLLWSAWLVLDAGPATFKHLHRSACCPSLSPQRHGKFFQLGTHTWLYSHSSISPRYCSTQTWVTWELEPAPSTLPRRWWGVMQTQMDILRHELNLRAFPGERRESTNHHYLTGHVRVEHFAFDDKPELLPVSLPFLAPAEIATDGRALSGGGHLAEEKQGGQGTRW